MKKCISCREEVDTISEPATENWRNFRGGVQCGSCNPK